MKCIPAKELSKLLSGNVSVSLLSLKNMEYVFDRYGDDYFIVDGEFALCKENGERKELLSKMSQPYKAESEG